MLRQQRPSNGIDDSAKELAEGSAHHLEEHAEEIACLLVGDSFDVIDGRFEEHVEVPACIYDGDSPG